MFFVCRSHSYPNNIKRILLPRTYQRPIIFIQIDKQKNVWKNCEFTSRNEFFESQRNNKLKNISFCPPTPLDNFSKTFHWCETALIYAFKELINYGKSNAGIVSYPWNLLNETFMQNVEILNTLLYARSVLEARRKMKIVRKM